MLSGAKSLSLFSSMSLITTAEISSRSEVYVKAMALSSFVAFAIRDLRDRKGEGLAM